MPITQESRQSERESCHPIAYTPMQQLVNVVSCPEATKKDSPWHIGDHDHEDSNPLPYHQRFKGEVCFLAPKHA
eukprot:3745765-Amphidinium_carterae.2